MFNNIININIIGVDIATDIIIGNLNITYIPTYKIELIKLISNKYLYFLKYFIRNIVAINIDTNVINNKSMFCEFLEKG